jgi:hypothetical protein
MKIGLPRIQVFFSFSSQISTNRVSFCNYKTKIGEFYYKPTQNFNNQCTNTLKRSIDAVWLWTKWTDLGTVVLQMRPGVEKSRQNYA